MEFTSRYGDGPLPDPETLCKGPCEGMGYVPVTANNADERYALAWAEAEVADPSDDGWHFVKCLDCNGTGKRAA